MAVTPRTTDNDGTGDERLERLLTAQIKSTERLTDLVERVLLSEVSNDGRQLVQEVVEMMQASSTQSVAESTQALAVAVAQLAPPRLTEEQYDLLADYEALRSELGRTSANGLVGLAWLDGTLRVTISKSPPNPVILVNGAPREAERVVQTEKAAVFDVHQVDRPADGRVSVEVRADNRPIRRAVLVVPQTSRPLSA